MKNIPNHLLDTMDDMQAYALLTACAMSYHDFLHWKETKMAEGHLEGFSFGYNAACNEYALRKEALQW